AQPLEIVRARESRPSERHLELPHLVRVARFDRELDRTCDRVSSGSADECVRPTFELGENVGYSVEVEVRVGGTKWNLEAPREIQNEGLGGLEGGPAGRIHHFGAPEQGPYRDGVDPRSPASTDEGGLSWIDPLMDCDLLDRAHHALSGDLQDRCGSLAFVEP